MAAGRPRAFDADAALESALRVFWQKGYEGTSLPDLTAAMGINRPSLYATFGNKEELFRKALDRYAERRAAAMRETLAQKPLIRAIESVLNNIADSCGCNETPKGCLLVQAALTSGEDAQPVRDELARRRAMSESILLSRFEQAKTEGELPAGTNPACLARYFTTIMQGMSVQSSGGAAPEELRAVAQMALKALKTA